MMMIMITRKNASFYNKTFEIVFSWFMHFFLQRSTIKKEWLRKSHGEDRSLPDVLALPVLLHRRQEYYGALPLPLAFVRVRHQNVRIKRLLCSSYYLFVLCMFLASHRIDLAWSVIRIDLAWSVISEGDRAPTFVVYHVICYMWYVVCVICR